MRLPALGLNVNYLAPESDKGRVIEMTQSLLRYLTIEAENRIDLTAVRWGESKDPGKVDIYTFHGEILGLDIDVEKLKDHSSQGLFVERILRNSSAFQLENGKDKCNLVLHYGPRYITPEEVKRIRGES